MSHKKRSENQQHDHHHEHHEHHQEHECYGKLLDIIEDLAEDLILAEEVLKGYICHRCMNESVHRLFRENPDSSYDEVGLHCHVCNKTL